MSENRAGWFPNPDEPSQWRYYDGFQWTDMVMPRPEMTPSEPTRPWFRRWYSVVGVIVAVLFGGFVLLANIGPGTDKKTASAASQSPVASPVQPSPTLSSPTPTPSPTETPTPSPTTTDQFQLALNTLIGPLNYQCDPKTADLWVCTSSNGGFVSVMAVGGVNGHMYPDEALALQEAGLTLTVMGDSENYPGQVVVGGF